MLLTPFQARLARVDSIAGAKALLLDALREENHTELVGGDYPFDVDLGGMLFHVQNRGTRPDEPGRNGPSLDHLGPMFSDAAWELCLDGVLRPGARSAMDKSSPKSSGYSLTQRGRAFLTEPAGKSTVAA